MIPKIFSISFLLLQLTSIKSNDDYQNRILGVGWYVYARIIITIYTEQIIGLATKYYKAPEYRKNNGQINSNSIAHSYHRK